MAKKKAKPAIAAAKPVHGASPEDITIKLNGKVYHLRFDYAALETAEMKLEKEGHNINMLLQLDMRTFGAVRTPFLFFAALVTQHPEMTFAGAKKLVNLRTGLPIHNAVCDAYIAGMVAVKSAEEKEPDPTPEPAAAL